MPGVGWEELWGSPHRQLTHVMTRLRTRKTIRMIKRCAAGVGLAVLALMSFIVMRPFGKTAQLDGEPLPARIPPVLTISVPVLSGTNFMPDEPRMPGSTTTLSSVDTRPAYAAHDRQNTLNSRCSRLPPGPPCSLIASKWERLLFSYRRCVQVRTLFGSSVIQALDSGREYTCQQDHTRYAGLMSKLLAEDSLRVRNIRPSTL
jgi:hypothetical protein